MRTGSNLVWVSSLWLSDSPLGRSFHMRNLRILNLCQVTVYLQSVSTISNKFFGWCGIWNKSCLSQTYLFHSSFKGWTFRVGALLESLTSEKKFPSVVKSYIKPRLLRGLWLQEAVMMLELGRWLELRLPGGLCGETIVCILVFIYVLVLFSSSWGTQMLWW